MLFVLTHIAEGAEGSGVAGGIDGIEADANLILHQFPHDGEGQEYPDGTGDGGGLGKDAVRRRGNVVASAGGVVAHADHNGLAGSLQLLDGVPDVFGAAGAAAAAVDPEYHGLHIVIFGQFFDLVDVLLVANVAEVTGAIDDTALGDQHGDLVVSSLQAFHTGGEVLADIDGVELLVLLDAELVVQQAVDLGAATDAVDEAGVDGLLVAPAGHVAGGFPELGGRHPAGLTQVG